MNHLDGGTGATGEVPPTGECPSCGRFVGPYARCPYCGTDVGQRMPIRILRVGSLVVALAGTLVLLLMASRSQVPAVAVGTVLGTMNWAYVRMEGVASRQPVYDAAAETIRLWIQDGTGEIMVLVPWSRTELGSAGDLAAVMGDKVSVEGTLRVREGFPYLVVEDPGRVAVVHAEPVGVEIAAIDERLLRRKVTVRGTIRGKQEPYPGLRILAVRDATGEIDVLLSSAAAGLAEGVPDPDVGQSVQVTGAVDQYRGTLQISVGQKGDLEVLDTAVVIAPWHAIAELSSDDVGEFVTVHGRITQVTPFSAGVKLVLEDESGAVTLLMWQDLVEALVDRELLVAGTAVQVQGIVAEYRGDLEVVPEVPSDLVALSAFEQQATEPGSKQQEIVQVTGTDPVRTTDRGDRLTHPTPATTPMPGLAAGAMDTFEQTRDRPPRPVVSVARNATTTPAPAATLRPTRTANKSPTPTVETRAIGGITNADLGTRFTIAQAGIVDMVYLSKGVKYTLSDGAGSIALVVWQNVMEEIRDRYYLRPGSRIQVTGEIEEYEGDLEVVPHSGAEIDVLVPGESLPIEERRVNAITPADEGRIFVVEGQVVRTERQRWLKIWLADGTGEILIFVPERTVEYLPKGVEAGVRLQVTGEVDIYQATLELIPLAGADVVRR